MYIRTSVWEAVVAKEGRIPSEKRYLVNGLKDLYHRLNGGRVVCGFQKHDSDLSCLERWVDIQGQMPEFRQPGVRPWINTASLFIANVLGYRVWFWKDTFSFPTRRDEFSLHDLKSTSIK